MSEEQVPSQLETDEDLVGSYDELEALKARAKLLGVSYHPSIGLDKLKDKINAAMADKPVPTSAENPLPVSQVSGEATPEETTGQRRGRKRREANELIRVRVACMNPAKKEWEGEIFTAGNSLIGSMTKFVPFNNDEGWHVPRIILNMMRERQCQIFTATRDGRGNTIRKPKMIKEFAIEVMDPLTPEELAELARRQATTLQGE